MARARALQGAVPRCPWLLGAVPRRCAPCTSPLSPLQFSESRRLLLDWMDEAEQALEAPQDTATSQEEIKCQLAEHKVRGELPRGGVPVGKLPGQGQREQSWGL